MTTTMRGINPASLKLDPWGALLAVSIVVTGCQSSAPKPEAMCASAETSAGLASVALSGIAPPPQDVHLVLDSPVLDSVDATTKRTTCTATFKLGFTGSMGKVAGNKVANVLNSGIRVDGQLVNDAVISLDGRNSFSIQPSADGKGNVYSMSNAAALGLRAIFLATRMVAASSQQTSSASTVPTETNSQADQTSGGEPPSAPPLFVNTAPVAVSPDELAATTERNAAEFANTPPMRAALQKLLGEKYAEFQSYMGVASDIETTANPKLIYGEAFPAHESGNYGAAYTIDKNGLVTVAIYSQDASPRVTVYGASSEEKLAPNLKSFIDQWK